MKLSKPLFFLLFFINFPGYTQIKDLYLISCNADTGTKAPLVYYRGEGITIMQLQGKFEDGNYRIYDASDSTLSGYIEVKNNKFDGAYILYDSEKNPTVVGLKKNNYPVGTWLHFSRGHCERIERFDNTIHNVDCHTDLFTSIVFYNKKEEVVRSINPKKIADQSFRK